MQLNAFYYTNIFHQFILLLLFIVFAFNHRHILLYKRTPSKNSVILFIFILFFLSHFNIFYYIRYIFYYIHYI